MNEFLQRLKERKLVQWALAYIAAAFALIQVLDIVAQRFGWPEQAVRLVIVVMAIGFFVTLVLAWYHGERGAQRVSGTELLILALLLALGGMAAWQLPPGKREAATGASASSAIDASAQTAAAATTSVSAKSIAVLPFVDMSQAKDQEYFSDGLSEELLDLLANVPQLKVIARTSSFSFKGKNADIAEIARKLAVATILEGSVRKSGNTLRITAQLIRASDSTHLWSETYERELTDVFKVQDEIASAVVAALKVKLLQANLLQAESNAGGVRTANMQAHDHYLLGNELMARGVIESYRQAVGEYQFAIDLDPGYASAYTGLANAYGYVADLTAHASSAALAMRATDKALSLAPKYPEALSTRAWLRAEYAWDWAGARSDYETALSVDPNNATALRRYAWLLATLGQLPEAVAMATRAHERDPVGDADLWTLGLLLNASGRFVDAYNLLRISAGPAPGEYVSMVLTESLILAGRYAEVAAETQASNRRNQLLGAAFAEFSLGHREASNAALAELTKNHADGLAYQIAEIHAWRGETDQAFEWLNRAYAQHDGGLATLKFSPFIASLRRDPRYAALLKKMGLPE